MILFISTLAMVFLMAFQQQNVTHGHYKMAMVTSFAIAVAQFALYKGVIAANYWGILEMGAGGAIGVTCSMYLHRRWRKSREKNSSPAIGTTATVSSSLDTRRYKKGDNLSSDSGC